MKKKYLGVLLTILLTGCGLIMDEPDTQIIVEYTPVMTQIEEVDINPVAGGFMNISMRNPISLNPILNRDITVDRVLGLIFEPLFTIEDMTPVPVLVQNIEISSDYTYAVLTIREDAMWEDGTPVTSTDVAFTINTIRNNEYSLYHNGVANIQGHIIIDSKNILITFHSPLGGRVEYSLLFPIIPSHFYSGNQLNIRNMQPLASGPFRLDRNSLPREIRLVANEYSFREPYISYINVIITPDLETDIHALNQGTIDLLSNSAGLSYLGVSTVGLNVYSYATNNIDFIAFNFDNIQMRDVRVRQGILYSAMTNDMIYSTYLGQARRSSSVVHPLSSVYKQGLNYFRLDTSRSLQLFSEGGFSYIGNNTLGTLAAGIPVPFTLRILVNEENEQRVQIAHVLKNNLESIGVSVNLIEVSFEQYLYEIENRNFDVIFGGVNVYPAWDLRFLLGTGGEQNVMGFESAMLDHFLMTAVYATDTQTYREAWMSIQEYLNQEVPLHTIAFRNGVLLVGTGIRGDISPSKSSIFRDVEQWFR